MLNKKVVELELDEEVVICDYDPMWSLWYNEESASLRGVFGPDVAIEHFGSTSVSGMVAKPIVDILIGFFDFPNIPTSQVQALKQLGYECLGTAGVPGRIYFRKRGIRSFNLAVTQYESALWKDNLLLRNYLRQNSNEARLYSEYKLRAYNEGYCTLLAYSDQKSAFVLELLQRAKHSPDA
jgi:GrpB-like predicted nucleotidyltransferase (UPF0157 family)